MVPLSTRRVLSVIIPFISILVALRWPHLSSPWTENPGITPWVGILQQVWISSLESQPPGVQPAPPDQRKESPSISSKLAQRENCIPSAIPGQQDNLFKLESPDCYTIGIITALPMELAAVEAMLDEEHLQPDIFEQSKADNTVYSWGRIGQHNVVVAAPKKGQIGKANAATVAGALISSITSIRIGLLVGIGGGIPRPELDPDIRLGDVVVSAPAGSSGGVIEYDLGKEQILGFKRTGFLNSPPAALLSAVTSLEAKHERGKENISTILDEALHRHPGMARTYQFPGWETDVLFPATYDHVGPPNCIKCNYEKKIPRKPRESTMPKVHYGVVASGDKVIKNARKRDEIVSMLQKEGVEAFAFEMEAAGLMNNFPCLVVRGICDYADSHKSDRWQRYAAMTAAAYAKELLRVMPPREIEVTPRAIEAIKELKAKIGEIKNEVHQVKETTELRSIRKWLDPPDPSENFNCAQEARHKGTGTWLLHGNQFVDWESGIHRHLWIHGIMGCGKTVIAAMIIEHLQEDCLYFFFDHTTKVKQDSQNLLRSLIYQLYIKERSLRGSMHKWFSSHEEGSRQPLPKSLLETFNIAVQKLGRVTIVLDALDECSTLHELLRWMENLLQDKAPVRFILTSRRKPDIEAHIANWIPEESIIEIEGDDVTEDIRSYISDNIRSDMAFRRWRSRPEVQEEIIRSVTLKSNGMFRLAVLNLEELKLCYTTEELEEQLMRLPQTLSEAYNNMLLRIPDHHKHDALRILQLMAFAMQPIDIEAVAEVLAFDDESLEYNAARRMPDPTDILEMCQGFLRLDTFLDSDILCERDSIREIQYIRLAHLSAQDFFTLGDYNHDLSGRFNSKEIDRNIAKLCLAYLSYAGRNLPNNANCSQLSQLSVATEFPFLRYAAYWFAPHAAASNEQEEFREQIIDLLRNDRNAIHIWKVILWEHCQDIKPASTSTLELEVDLVEAMKVFTTSEQLTQLDNQDIMALVDAITSNWKAIPFQKSLEYYPIVALQTFVTQGVDVQDLSEAGITPLHMALLVKDQSKDLVQFLLDQGANVGAITACGTTILQTAMRNSSQDIIELLVRRGAIEADRGRDTSVPYATDRREVELIRFLLDNGADINGCLEDVSAIRIASYYGDLDIIQLLLDYGADVNSESCGPPPLKAACQENHTDAVKLLVSRGARIDPHEGLVHLAVELGNQELFDFLRVNVAWFHGITMLFAMEKGMVKPENVRWVDGPLENISPSLSIGRLVDPASDVPDIRQTTTNKRVDQEWSELKTFAICIMGLFSIISFLLSLN